MAKLYFSKAYFTYLGFLTFGLIVTLLGEIFFGNLNTAGKKIVPIYIVAAISPLALKRIELDQNLEKKMGSFLSTIKQNDDKEFLQECWEKEIEGSDRG